MGPLTGSVAGFSQGVGWVASISRLNLRSSTFKFMQLLTGLHSLTWLCVCAHAQMCFGLRVSVSQWMVV